MCKFFSANSDGNGNVEFFKVGDIARIMAEGNQEKYDWNSHTSIADFNGHKGREEDKWNKWEYNPGTKELTADSLVAQDDGDMVKEKIEEYLKGKDIGYLRNLYNLNSGDLNSGDQNPGNLNSGDQNSGNQNSGHQNSGDNNSGCIIGHFTSQKLFFLFNKPCTKEDVLKVYELELWRWFNLTEWIVEDIMTDEEKQAHPEYKATHGYLKVRTYKEAWALVPKEIIEKIKELKNFDAEVFEEITGIKVNAEVSLKGKEVEVKVDGKTFRAIIQ